MARPPRARRAPSLTGFVDTLDVENGACGWAVDTADLDRPVRLELCVGDRVVAETVTDGRRDDISIKFGRRVSAGFRFDTAVMAGVAELAAAPGDAVFVRLAGAAALEAGVALPSAASLAAEAKELGRAAAPGDDFDMEMLLDGLRGGGAAMAGATLRPLAEGLRGYVETLVIDPSGMVWFIGWMRQGHPPEFGGVIADSGNKHVAAAAVMCFSREDLPGDATGIMGVLATDWRPGAATKDMQLYFGPGGRFHLRAHTPLRIISFKELLSDFSNLRERLLGDRHTGALQAMLTAMETWLPGRASGLRYGTESSIDRILLVPGLGCLAEGWIMSPMKRIEGFRMRVGAAVMTARPDALYWKPRPDLLGAFPRSETMARRAGFVALFTGQGDTADLAEPVLKVIFEGGHSANWDIAPTAFRRLGHSATIEDALAFFPALQDEPFFPRFARAAIGVQRGAMAPPVPMRVPPRPREEGPNQASPRPSPAAIVLVLPEDRCDLFLLFEEVAHRGRGDAAAMPRVIFVASAGAGRSDALWLFRDFEVQCPACSLTLIDEAEHALALLPDILREAGVSRFVFVAAGMFLTKAGWDVAAEALQPGRSDLVLFATLSDPPEPDAAGTALSARCFAWSTAPFTEWSRQALPFFGGYHRDNGLCRADPAYAVRPAAARASRTLIPTRIREAVNEAVYGQRDAA